jgi:respiratory-subunit NADH dehydrogenase subunit
MTAEGLRERLGGTWAERGGAWRRAVDAGEVRAVARAMLEAEARFAALVARPCAGGGARLAWHWDAAGALLSLEATLPAGAAAPSIADVYPGADWAEREAHDAYGVAFTGRATQEPLLRREGDAPGLLLGAGSRP